MSILHKIISALFVPAKVNARLLPKSGIEKIDPFYMDGDSNGPCIGVLEPSVIVDTDDIKIYFTKSVTGTDNVICIATTTVDLNGEWTINQTPVIGMGYGGAPADRRAHSSVVLKTGSDYYCYATNGYGDGGSGEDRCVYLYHSTDGLNWTDMGLLLPVDLIPGSVGYGNTSVYPVLVNGVYQMLVEASVDGIWQIYNLTSTSLTSGWTYVGIVQGLQIGSGNTYGGMQHFLANGVWQIYWHYGLAGNLPTVLGYATSLDLFNITLQETPLFGLDTQPYVPTDQLADPWIVEVNNQVFLLAEYCTNGALGDIFKSQLWMWHYNGTYDQLITDLQ